MVGVEPVAIDSTADLGARAIARVRRRLIPFLALLYFVAYLDRVNVGFAALQMNRALDLSPLDFGRGAGIFFLGYFLFEVPSNLALARVGARIWIARIAIVWGLVSMAMVVAAGPASFALLRFLLDAHPELACPPETRLAAVCAQLAGVWSQLEGSPLPAGRVSGPPLSRTPRSPGSATP